MDTKRKGRVAITWRRLRRYPATLAGFAIFGFFLALAPICPPGGPHK